MSKKGMICVRSMDVCTGGDLRRKAEGGKITSTEAITRLTRESCFEKPTRSVPEIWGRMYDALPCSSKGTRNGTRNQIPVQPRKAQRNE